MKLARTQPCCEGVGGEAVTDNSMRHQPMYLFAFSGEPGIRNDLRQGDSPI